MNHNHLIGNPYNLMYDVIHSIIFLPSIEYDQLFNPLYWLYGSMDTLCPEITIHSCYYPLTISNNLLPFHMD